MVSTERYARVIVIHERFGSMVWFQGSTNPKKDISDCLRDPESNGSFDGNEIVATIGKNLTKWP